jgi:hypothetical protein
MEIEFRWLDKGWALNRGGRRTISHELQYRVMEEIVDSDDHRCKAWSKWRTVPTVKANVPPESGRKDG